VVEGDLSAFGGSLGSINEGDYSLLIFLKAYINALGMSEIAEQEKKRLKEGWIKTKMMIEVLAVGREAAQSSLEKHVGKMEKEKKALVSRKEFHELQYVENPIQGIPEGWSYVVDLDVLAENFEVLIGLVMNYGPSSVEIIEPSRISVPIDQGQAILVSVADLLHQFARLGAGGIVVNT